MFRVEWVHGYSIQMGAQSGWNVWHAIDNKLQCVRIQQKRKLGLAHETVLEVRKSRNVLASFLIVFTSFVQELCATSRYSVHS